MPVVVVFGKEAQPKPPWRLRVPARPFRRSGTELRRRRGLEIGVDGVVANAVHGMLPQVGAWCWVHHCGDKKVVG